MEKQLKDLEYETQFFGCSSLDVKEGIEGLLKEKINASVDDLVETLKERCKDVSGESIVEIGRTIINSFLNASTGPLKELEEEIKKYFKIPSYVLLPEDQPQEVQYSSEEVQKIDDEISSLLKRVEVAKYMNAALKEEYKTLRLTLEEKSTKLAELEKIIEENATQKRNLLNILEHKTQSFSS